MRRLAAFLLLGTALVAQRWQDTCGKTPSGQVQLLQAAKDAGSDALVLLVAAHPDDRYVLPATWIRSCLGARVAVLLATRGGGGQNSLGPESGDAFERIRTLEAEAGCSHFGADVYYLDRPDCGYRRTAEEAFAEWGRDGTLRDLVRLIRTIRPDVVATTHHAEEAHGHDRALAELLPEAVALAHDPAFSTTGPPHRVRAFLLGGGGVSLPTELRVPADRLEPLRGRTLRRLAYDVLAKAHVSPGALAPLETIFEAELRFAPQILPGPTSAASPFGPLPSLFDDDLWPGDRAEVQNLRELLERDLPALAARGAAAIEPATRALQRLRELARDRPPGDVAARLARRIEALERLLLQLHGVSIETEVPPGAAAIAGEEFPVAVHLHAPDDLATTLRAEGLDGIEVGLETLDGRDLAQPDRGPVNALATVRMPLRAARSGDPIAG
ncbi:MAG: PIG-L family deacetylase, partial [Planctomycetes bacterium]|nr:PIG-L family deacetylase [Planctomycetota bacterium]